MGLCFPFLSKAQVFSLLEPGVNQKTLSFDASRNAIVWFPSLSDSKFWQKPEVLRHFLRIPPPQAGTGFSRAALQLDPFSWNLCWLGEGGGYWI